MTGLPRRQDVITYLDRALRSGDDRVVNVLLLDIEDFRQINHTFGYDIGDAVLRATAERLEICVGDGFVGRTGANEFVAHLPTGADAERVAARLLSMLSMLVSVGEQEIAVRVSIGLASGTSGRDQTHEVLRRASLASEAARQTGGSQYVTFHQDLADEADARGTYVADLTHALGHDDELFLCFQPIIGTAHSTPFAVEVLARWDHPQRGTLVGGAFVPQAEASGLVGRLDRWVLQHACHQAASWPEGLAGLPVTVNMSALSASASTLCCDVETALSGSGLDPERLILEITETALLRDVDRVAEQLLALRAMGVRVALDDFGTGYSSLSYLERLPFDWLKLDASYSKRVGEDRRAQAILGATLQIADALGMAVIVEGIESAGHARLLNALGVELFQGFYFARPQMEHELPDAMAAATGRAAQIRAAGATHRVPDTGEDELLSELAGRLQSRIEGAVDEVRRTIAAELHDDPIQALWAADLSLEASLGDVQPVDQLLLAQQGVRRAMKRLRELMTAVRPPDSDQDLAGALRSLVAEFSSRMPVTEIDVRLDNLDYVEEADVVLTIRRIVGEALANIHKHARATAVTIEVRGVGQSVEIAVTDDGVGFDPQRTAGPSSSSGYGMTSMHDRAGNLGGLLTVQSRPGGGTTVQAILPLRHSSTGGLQPATGGDHAPGSAG